ncbi:MAG: ABC transporter substrate-binding protein [Deltaproteobacteria bacterium]|nr:ABC transporter substrate-binding protein [Deltaproteobacteria bacterium]
MSLGIRMIFIFLSAALAAACMPSRARAQSTGKNEPIRIAYPSRGITVLPLRLAQTQGLFQQERLDAELIQMRAGITVTAMASGDIQFGAPTDSIVRSAARGQPLKGVLSFVNKPMHYLVAKANFNTVEELRGKTLAINSFGASEQLTLWALLKAHGIDPDKKEVQVVGLGDSPVRLEALKRGIVDATVVLIPHVIIARNSGFKVLGHGGSYLELSTPGIGVTDQFLKEKRDQAKRTVRALVKAILFMRKNREESVRVAMSWLALDRDVAEKSYDMALDSFSEDGSPTLKGLQNSVALERQRVGIKEEIPLSKVFDFSLLQEVHAELKR